MSPIAQNASPPLALLAPAPHPDNLLPSAAMMPIADVPP